MNSRGVALILVLTFILVVVVLANIALIFVTSQARFIHHETSRIQAKYAAFAGINYAFERLRVGDWTTDVTDKYYCINDDGSTMTCTDGNTVDDEIPYGVEIHIYPEGGGISGTTQIDTIVSYTFS